MCITTLSPSPPLCVCVCVRVCMRVCVCAALHPADICAGGSDVCPVDAVHQAILPPG